MSTVAIVRHHLVKIKKSRHKPRVFRTPVISAFLLNDDYFRSVFRVSKQTAKHIVNTLRADIEPRSGIKTAVSAESKVLCALRYFASGSLQREIGQDLLVHLSQAAVSRAIVAVSEGICKYLGDYVAFPPPNEYEDTNCAFSAVGGFPGVVGAMGCTHIPIATPPDNDPSRPKHGFLNPNGYYSLNVLLVCDAEMKISHVNAQYPGASMDWFVWKHSDLRSVLEETHSRDSSDFWLLGGGSFQPEPWLLTPIQDPSSEAEGMYNHYHQRTRQVVAECTRRWKQRFGCLRRGIRHNAAVAECIVRACAILHNMCLNEEPEEEDSFRNEEEDSDSDVDTYYYPSSDLTDGNMVYVPTDESTNEAALLQRSAVVDSHFS